MYHEDHGPPHRHATHGEHRAVFGCEPVRHLKGRLPDPVRRQVLDWAALHRNELLDNWHRVQAGEAPVAIAPLP